MKRVLIVIPTFPVLSETFIEREVAGLIKSEKLDVKVVAMAPGSEFRSELVGKITTFYRLNPLDAFLALSYFVTRPKKAFKAWKTLGFFRPYLFLKSLGYARAFSKYDPEIIYVHFLSEPSSIALVASIVLDVPLAISAHARDVLEYPDLVPEKVEHSKFITICNKNARNRLIELSGQESPKNVVLTYHGVDMKDLNVEVKIKKPNVSTLLSIGRLVEKKGVTYLIDAAKILKDRGVEFKLFVVGGGVLFDELSEQVGSLSLENEVELLGQTPFSDVAQYHNLADIYVQSSVNVESGDADGITNGLIEAGLLAKPLVATDAGSFKDFLDDDVSIMVKQRDPEGLADGLEKLIKDKALREKLGNAVNKRAKEMFNIEKSINKLVNLLLS